MVASNDYRTDQADGPAWRTARASTSSRASSRTLRPHLQDYAPNFYQAMQSDEEIRRKTHGRGLRRQFACGLTHFGLQVRKDWCDKLGIGLRCPWRTGKHAHPV
jgi:hypothetical protein